MMHDRAFKNWRQFQTGTRSAQLTRSQQKLFWRHFTKPETEKVFGGQKKIATKLAKAKKWLKRSKHEGEF